MNQNGHKHIFLKDIVTSEAYRRPGSGFPQKNNMPNRERLKHGQKLKNDIQNILDISKEYKENEQVKSFGLNEGIVVQFISEPGFELALKSLDTATGIELISVKTIKTENSDLICSAAVYIPDGQMSKFIKKIDEYLEEPEKNFRMTRYEENKKDNILFEITMKEILE